MIQAPTKPSARCDECMRPYDYAPNPQWPDIMHLFKRNPSQGYWLLQEHVDCVSRQQDRTLHEKNSRDRATRNSEIKRAMNELGFPRIQADKPFERFHVEPGNRQAHDALHGWTPRKTGVLLYGPPGRGKSHLMAAFAKKWSDLGENVAYVNMSSLLALLRKGYEDDLFNERLRFVSTRVQILVLDDLGAEKPTEWGEEKLYMIIDARLTSELPLFVTTNCTDKELESKFHPRILSRLRETCTWMEVGGRDWRAQIQQARQQPGGRA